MVLPPVRDALASGTPVEGLALAEAAWARMCAGTRENGTTIEPNDPFWDDLVATATAAKNNPGAWLEMRNNYGDLADQPPFAEAFGKWLTMIWANGIEAAIDAYCASGSSPA